MQWMTMTSVVPCHALHAPEHAAASDPYSIIGTTILSVPRQFTDTYFGDSSPTKLETVHRHI